ncbi:Ger(x)C family spore germination protein [Paenibacillus filicis]|uniref:Ger(X)C family spore germination protein n=1 Tax=Paenibacillus gyeongsangnamensis TaxID=3388067 RepID=A0ABT4QB19_9BACL|nr:Ger(x)C family spore germination protein [Paenibacillus filicis]MCZ8514018.1 Ger(x)C family spore germination protein [Paenibacillus filicis]
MLRKVAVRLLPALFLCAVTGCWSRTELNDIAITLAIGLDKKGDQYMISTQMVNPSEVAAKKGGGGKGAPVVTFSETGDTVFEAFRKITTKAPRRLYFSHLRMLIISEPLAKEGIAKALDLLLRNHEFRSDFYIVIARGLSAQKVLEIYTMPQELIPANNIYKTLQHSSKSWATAGKVTLDELINDITAEGKHPALTGIDVLDDPSGEQAGTQKNAASIKPISVLRVSGLAVFYKDRLKGWLNEQESKAYNYIKGNVKNTVDTVACPKGGKLSVEVIRTKSEIIGKIPNGKPEVSVELYVEGNVADVECNIDLTQTDTIDELEKRMETEIKDHMKAAIHKAQKTYRSDIFGFGEAIHRADPKVWNRLKDHWVQEFVDLPVNLRIHVKLRRVGTINKPFFKQLEE